MKPQCPNCANSESECPDFIHKGHYYRRSDSKWIKRFKCLRCGKNFSQATHQLCYGQNKRRMNAPIRKLFCSAVSLRRSAKILGINRKTVARKLKFLARVAEHELDTELEALPPATEIQLDDLETIEHSKCKPLSVLTVVEHKTRRILGFNVARMPAKGHLAKIALKKYGKRADDRREARKKLFTKLQPYIHPGAVIISDEHPHYPEAIKKFFPKAIHKCFKGRRACVAGQGELKQGGFDPLFSINHTFAMKRANISRLIRRSWCTTKKPESLRDHLLIYAHYHNTELI